MAGINQPATPVSRTGRARSQAGWLHPARTGRMSIATSSVAFPCMPAVFGVDWASRAPDGYDILGANGMRAQGSIIFRDGKRFNLLWRYPLRRNGIPRSILFVLFAYISTLFTRSYNSLDPQSDVLTLKCESCLSSSESAEARGVIGRKAFLRPNILLRAVRRTDLDRSGVEEMRRRANSVDGREVSMEGLDKLTCGGGAYPGAPVSCGLIYSSLSSGSCIGIG